MSSYATLALYLPFLNAILYGLYYALFQETVGALSLTTILFVNGLLFIILASCMSFFGMGEIQFEPLKERSLLKIFISLVALSAVLHVTHYLALKNTSATYMAFAELSYPLFVPIFTYYLFSKSELTSSIVMGGVLILIGSVIIGIGGVKT